MEYFFYIQKEAGPQIAVPPGLALQADLAPQAGRGHRVNINPACTPISSFAVTFDSRPKVLRLIPLR